MALSAAKKSMKYFVANTENMIEYGFKGADEGATLEVNPKAGLSNARTLEAVSFAKGFMTWLQE